MVLTSDGDPERLMYCNWAVPIGLSGSEVNPGEHYVFDKKARRLHALGRVRPDLAEMTLATGSR